MKRVPIYSMPMLDRRSLGAVGLLLGLVLGSITTFFLTALMRGTEEVTKFDEPKIVGVSYKSQNAHLSMTRIENITSIRFGQYFIFFESEDGKTAAYPRDGIVRMGW